MTTDDDFQDALTEGLTALALVQTEQTTDPTWPAALDGLERALTAIHTGAAWSNTPVHEHDLATLRRVRAFVDEWLATGQRPAGIALAASLYFSLTRGSATVLEHSAELTPADGGPRRGVTLRIGDVRQTGESWSARVDLVGFGRPTTTRIEGADWAEAIERAARFVAIECQKDGTLDPPIGPRRLRDRLRAWWAMRGERQTAR